MFMFLVAAHFNDYIKKLLHDHLRFLFLFYLTFLELLYPSRDAVEYAVSFCFDREDRIDKIYRVRSKLGALLHIYP